MRRIISIFPERIWNKNRTLSEKSLSIAIDISSISKRQWYSPYLGLLLFYFEGSALVSLALSARITWQWRDLGVARALRMNELIILRRDRRQLRPERHNLNESGRADCNIDRNYAKSGTTTSPSAAARRARTWPDQYTAFGRRGGKGFRVVYRIRAPGRLLTFTWAREYIKRGSARYAVSLILIRRHMDIAGQLHSNTSTPLANKITCLTPSALSTALTDPFSVTALKILLYSSDKPTVRECPSMKSSRIEKRLLRWSRDRYLPT